MSAQTQGGAGPGRAASPGEAVAPAASPESPASGREPALILARESESDRSTRGELIHVPSGVRWQTLELPWRDNARSVSRIPAGDYPLVLRRHGGFADRYRRRWGHEGSIEIAGVHGRDAILIHCGNGPEHTRGCVLVGLTGGRDRVGQSRPAYLQLWAAVSASITRGSDPLISVVDDEAEDDDLLDASDY